MILVAGATGSLGGRIARELLGRGDAVRVLVRPESNFPPLEAAGAEVALGDLRNAATLRLACEGVDFVISTASATRRADDTPENVDARGTQNLIDAAREAGVRHFVVVSTVGATAESPLPAFRAKAAAEDHLRRSGLSYTILQPAPFMDVWFAMMVEAPLARGAPVTLVGESRRRFSFIAERDVAAFALAALDHPGARNATLVIGGPKAISFTDVVQAYEAAVGRPIPINRVAPGEPIPGLPEPVWAIAATLETFELILPMDETARQYGVELTSVEQFARASIAALGVPGDEAASPSPQHR